MQSIADFLPDVEDLLSLDEGEFGLLVLRLMNEVGGRPVSLHDVTYPLFDLGRSAYPLPRKRHVEDALAEAFQ
ncbi:MAG TPA: hypothetical protein VF606_01690, partial [Geminicoccaceae bacterium]